MLRLNKLGHRPQEVRVDGLGGRLHVYVVKKTMDDGEGRSLTARRSFLQNLDQKSQHLEGEVRIEVVQILDHASEIIKVESIIIVNIKITVICDFLNFALLRIQWRTVMKDDSKIREITRNQMTKR